MNDKRLNDVLTTYYSTKFTMSECLKAQTKRKLYEKQERRNNFILCLIQISMFIMTLSIVTTVFIINQAMAGTFLLSFTVAGVFISTVMILLYSKNNKNTGRIKFYD